jgi:glycosyltransferase involved in cell wall biosynthesis
MKEVVFITENEMHSYDAFLSENKGNVIYNIAEVFPNNVKSHPDIPSDSRLKIACISNYSWNRGTDRLIEIAQELKIRNNKNILFVVAGSMRLTKSMPGKLGKLAREGKDLRDYAIENSVSEYFVFLGFDSTPERVIQSCDALIKLTRWDATWGRDVIESLVNGVPVYTIGQYNKFVIDNFTGILCKKYDPILLADIIEHHESHRSVLSNMGLNAKKHVTHFCNGDNNASKLLSVWENAIYNS